jgi:hypothetical protein
MNQKSESEYKYSLNKDEDFLLSLEFAEIIKEKLTKGKKDFKFYDEEKYFKEFLDDLFVPDVVWKNFYDEKVICRIPSEKIKTLNDLNFEIIDKENNKDIYFDNSNYGFSDCVVLKVFNAEKSNLNFYWRKMTAILKKIKNYKIKLKDEHNKRIERERQMTNLKMLAEDLNVEIVEK